MTVGERVTIRITQTLVSGGHIFQEGDLVNVVYFGPAYYKFRPSGLLGRGILIPSKKVELAEGLGWRVVSQGVKEGGRK